MENPQEIIGQLSPNDALAVLKALAREDEALAARIVEIAPAYLSEVDPGEVAFDLYDELNALEVEEVWDRAGPTRRGYVDPGEAAGQMVEEIIDPYLEELRKYQALRMNAQANRMCMGCTSSRMNPRPSSRTGHRMRQVSSLRKWSECGRLAHPAGRISRRSGRSSRMSCLDGERA